MLMAADLFASDILTVHYRRDAGTYQGWNLWVWDAAQSGDGFAVEPKTSDAYGLVFTLDLEQKGLSGKKTGLLPRLEDWRDKDGGDRFYLPGMPREIWLSQNDDVIYLSSATAKPFIKYAYLDSGSVVRVVLSRQADADFLKHVTFSLDAAGRTFSPHEMTLGQGKSKVVNLVFRFPSAPSSEAVNAGQWRLSATGLDPVAVRIGTLADEPYFHYNKELGVIFGADTITERVFAPYAASASVLLKTSLSSEDVSVLPMKNAGHGVWECELPKAALGQYYRIRVNSGGKVTEGIDPYSRCNTAHDGWGIIVQDKTPIVPSPVFPPSESIIYEAHVRDMTIDPRSGVHAKGKYLGLTETGTRHSVYPDVKTGLDHLVELGVNTVQIMPVQDFENDESSSEYGWGYMPVHFNSPDGWYASRTDTPVRIKELKEMISAFHSKGIKVVMDVVYNHTAETMPDKAWGFNAVAPGYYYRLKNDGSYYNGSGCGNEFRSDSYMGRKFIIDSLSYWVREYDVDGFRFDLMALIDKDTVEKIARELKKIKPDILVYGEPWAAGDTPIDKLSKGSQRSKGFSVFNDTFRDAIKGSVFDLQDGYVQHGLNREKIMEGIKGSIDDFTDSPLETINYVSCHDNHTLWDRLQLSTTDEATLYEQIAMDTMANGIILTSQGIPFIHAGEEMLRTKQGYHNTYNMPDYINMLDWSRKHVYGEVFDYYRNIIALRKAHPAFRMATSAAVRRNLAFYEDLGLPVHPPAIAYVLNGAAVGDSWKEIVVLINPLKYQAEFALPAGGYYVAANGMKFLPPDSEKASETFMADALSVSVLYRK